MSRESKTGRGQIGGPVRTHPSRHEQFWLLGGLPAPEADIGYAVEVHGVACLRRLGRGQSSQPS